MFEKYCISVLKYIQEHGTATTRTILPKLDIPEKYADAIDSKIYSSGWADLSDCGLHLLPAGSAFLAELELNNKKQPHQLILEYLEPHGIGRYVILNPILSQMFSLNNKHDISEAQQVSRQIKDLLNGLESNNLIQLGPNKFNHLGWGNTTDGFKWLDTAIIKASIKTPGLDLLRKEQTKSTGDTIINTGTLIHSSPINHSSVSTYLDQSHPIEIQTQAVKNKSQSSFWVKAFKWIGNHIVQILIALLVAYLVFRFGWT